MKKNNKSGFTLIELLAIIVILAIIAVITVPIILNVIDNAKKGSIKDSAYGYKDAINKYYVSELYDNQNLKLNGTYTITDKGELSDGTNVYEIPFTGTTPTGGYLNYENNILTDGCITIDEYNATVENGKITTVEKGSCGEATASKFITIVGEPQVEGKITSGDEYQIGTEHFYVVSSDENETVLLARYNLNVGKNTQDEAYGKLGMQNSKAIGYNDDSSTQDEAGDWPATVPFSSTNYWWDDSTSSSKTIYVAEDSYHNTVYDANYNGMPGEDDYSIAYYVEQYKEKLIELGAIIKESRLLTYSESLKNTAEFPKNNRSKLYATSFWLGTSSSDIDIASIYGVIDSYDDNYWFDEYSGVRPVIVVNTSDI